MSTENDAVRPERFTMDGLDFKDEDFEDDPDETWPVDLPDTSYDHAKTPPPDKSEDESE